MTLATETTSVQSPIISEVSPRPTFSEEENEAFENSYAQVRLQQIENLLSKGNSDFLEKLKASVFPIIDQGRQGTRSSHYYDAYSGEFFYSLLSQLGQGDGKLSVNPELAGQVLKVIDELKKIFPNQLENYPLAISYYVVFKERNAGLQTIPVGTSTPQQENPILVQ